MTVCAPTSTTRIHSPRCSQDQSGARSHAQADCFHNTAQPIARIRDEEHRTRHSPALHTGASLWVQPPEDSHVLRAASAVSALVHCTKRRIRGVNPVVSFNGPTPIYSLLMAWSSAEHRPKTSMQKLDTIHDYMKTL